MPVDIVTATKNVHKFETDNEVQAVFTAPNGTVTCIKHARNKTRGVYGPNRYTCIVNGGWEENAGLSEEQAEGLATVLVEALKP